MALQGFTVEGFRCFRTRTRLDLRPITVLLGKNNSGKSAISRVPLLAASSLAGGSASPIILDDMGLDAGAAFVDLLYGRRPHGAVAFEFEVDLSSQSLGVARVLARIQNIDEYQTQVVSELTVRHGDNAATLTWDEQEVLGVPRWYRLTSDSTTERTSPIEFQGFMPRTSDLPLEISDWMGPVLHGVQKSFDEIRYIGPFREQAHRLYRTPASGPGVVGQLGANAPAIVASNELRGDGSILAKVNTYLRSVTAPWQLRVDTSATNFSLQLVSDRDESLAINLADTGVGLAQVLPILVQAARDGREDLQRAAINIVEQPELHLHPAAHSSLADLYIDTVRTTSSRFIIETHSENLVLRLRRRVAEGLDTNLIALYFVDHDGGEASIHPIELTQDGRIYNWPDGVFSEDLADVRAMNQARES